MTKRYQITITEFVEEKTLTHREYSKGVKVTDTDPDGWGHTPQVKEVRIVEREIYKQNTNTMDLITVIKAVNGIKINH